jgi:3',5'-cyclic AMP phosphodiesterase CpdA
MFMRMKKRFIAIILGLLVTLSILPIGAILAQEQAGPEVLQIGIFADLHAHDTDSPGEGKVMTNYRERLQAFVDAMNAWPADLVIELGDLVNGKFVLGAELGEAERIIGILDDAESVYAQFEGPRYYVLGNHEFYDLSKEEFLEHSDAAATYLSFDAGAYHFVILDAQYSKTGKDYAHMGWVVQGSIPESELDWLREDLAATDKPTIVCIHQPLDVDFALLAGGPEVSNNKAVQAVLRDAGVVIAVFQGHSHENAYNLIDDIHYVTFQALLDHTEPTPPSWAMVTLDPTAQVIMIEGEGEQADWILEY